MLNNILPQLNAILGEGSLSLNEPMCKHTTFKIGGPADVLVEPESTLQIAELIRLCKENAVPYFIMGNGSNILVSDKGIRGVVIKIANNLSYCSVDGNIITAECGIKLSRLANFALNNSLTGLEFASGIPGTLGGAVFMNAGAYGGEMKDVIKSVTYLDTIDGTIYDITADMCDFGYRKSVFSNKYSVILKAIMELEVGDPQEIKATMSNLATKRNEKQPVDKPSAGSTFKRPAGYFAGTMIEECGLKGYKIGGAEVSVKHAGFIINSGDATAKDVLELIEYVRNTVMQRFGVELEPEVRLVGEF